MVSTAGTQATGHKLRLRIPDTAVIEGNVLKAWLYTEKQTGVLHATPRSQLSTSALKRKLQGQHAAYAVDNPHSWVAVAYFANCITRLVTADELEELLSRVYVGAVPEDASRDAAAGQEGLQLLALQGYVIPAKDVRYITTFGGVEGPAMLTQVHSYSNRFSAGASSQEAAEAAAAAIQQALKAEVFGPHEAGACSCLSNCGYAADAGTDTDVTAAGDAAGSVLCGASCGSGAGAIHTADAGRCSVQAAPGSVARATAAALQVLVSYLDKAHGLRVQGMAAEFIRDARQQLWLVGLHSMTLDPQQSRGSAATFTQRWGEFLVGAGPPPAPHPPQHTSYGRSAGGCEEPSCGHAAPASAPAEQQDDGAGSVSGGLSAARRLSPMQQLNRNFFPLLAVDASELPRWRPQSASAVAHGSVRLIRLSSCSPARQRPASSAAAAALSVSMDSTIAGRMSGGVLGSTPGSTAGCALGQAGGARYTSRNAASAARPGAGGNPTSKPTSSDSYSLWMQQPLRPSDSTTAQLACQLEWCKERVQRYAELAEAAQLQAGSTVEQATQHVASVQQELLQLRHDASAASRERRRLQQHMSELEARRSSTGAAMLQLQQQLADVQEQLAQDRATMATMLRQHQQQKQQLEEDVGQLQQQNGELRGVAQQLQARLGEEGEVVSALRAQLVDYKLQMEQMQLQGKKGRSLYNSSSTAGRRGSSTTPPGQLQGAAGSMAMGLSSSGYAFVSSSGLGPGSLDGAGGPQLLGVGGGWSQRR
ncbi:hypothetical protein COO60DRAFT_1686902 [Scenedesmus sp. NREL 46B-D3]|nr:hypothetical protein COO60DRAFT_1686902 [Scenedesmus sp. NREL 46B-D3]